MAELTHLEEKLGEVIGLAMAAQTATQKVIKLEKAESAKDILERMNEEAAEKGRRPPSSRRPARPSRRAATC
jgi:hypothetical protein